MASGAAAAVGRARRLVAACAWLLCAAGPAAGQRLRQYNLWVCPHCERGVKAADVTDLKCEGEASRSGGTDWRWVKDTLHRFLRTLRPSTEPRPTEDVEKLMHMATLPIQGECYLGIVALGFFSFNFMDIEERQLFIRSTVFGGVTFQRIVPLSYWDVYASGWPIFGLLAVAGEAVQRDIVEVSGRAAETNATRGGGIDGGAGEALEEGADANVGITGIDLGPRECCDFPGAQANSEDQDFLLALSKSLGGLAWVQGSGALPLHVPLQYLAASAHRRCSWGRATAYFALAESLLAAHRGAASAHWNSTRALFSLGEHNLDGCEANTTVYHLMQSVWPFWHILGRLEQRHLQVEAPPLEEPGERFVDEAPAARAAYEVPRASPSSVRLKWRHLLRSRGLAAGASAPAGRAPPGAAQGPEGPGPAEAGQALSCVDGAPGLAHVALSADLKQIDGFIVTLHSGTLNAGRNASRLCFHAFVLPHQRTFITEERQPWHRQAPWTSSEALRCSFGSSMEVLGGVEANRTEPEALAFRLNGTARLLLHSLDAARVWRSAGLPAKESEDDPGKAVMVGEVDLRRALYSDTGDLGAVHNFARFALHELLPRLPRVVYLDVDILVKGDLCELYDTPMVSAGGEAGTIAAVRRSNQPLRVYVDVLRPAMPIWVPSEAPSFNAGVMVIDLERWRQRRVSHLIAEWIALNARRRIWLHGSQPPLLLLFHDEVVPLHWTWNVDGLGHRLNYPKDVLRQAKVLHWTGPLKPWRHHGVNRLIWEPYTLEYCPRYSFREHTTTCRPDSWFC